MGSRLGCLAMLRDARADNCGSTRLCLALRLLTEQGAAACASPIPRTSITATDASEMKKDLFNKCVWDGTALQRAESDRLLFWAVGAAPALVLVKTADASPRLDNSPVPSEPFPSTGP